MKQLSFYLKNATDFQEGYGDVKNLRQLSQSDPERIEQMWQDLFQKEGSMVTTFKKLLEESDLYVQYETRKDKFSAGVPRYMALRTYPYPGKKEGVACLKVSVHE